MLFVWEIFQRNTDYDTQIANEISNDILILKLKIQHIIMAERRVRAQNQVPVSVEDVKRRLFPDEPR